MKRFIIEVSEGGNPVFCNVGFLPFELLGALDLARAEITTLHSYELLEKREKKENENITDER